MEVPLPWERLLWSGRSLSLRRTRYVLTDFRLVSITGAHADEMALYDIGDVRRSASFAERCVGRSTLVVRARTPTRPSFTLHRISKGEQLAGILELLAADSPDLSHAPDPDAIKAALASTPWQLRPRAERYRDGLIGIALVLTLVFGVVAGLHGKAPIVVYPDDDAIYPAGRRRTQEDIVRFMEEQVMPWARANLGPIVGGADRVRCETCHGLQTRTADWQMPGVAELPKPDVAQRGWEQYSTSMDAQMRNAIYGYVAESDNQARAKYMREVVMPGMAALLHRPAYDFTRSYDFNRTHAAFGCYHCHAVR